MFNFLQSLCCYSKREKPDKTSQPIQQQQPSLSIQPIKIRNFDQEENSPQYLETDQFAEYYLNDYDYSSTSPRSNFDRLLDSDQGISEVKIETEQDSDQPARECLSEPKIEMEQESIQESSNGIKYKKICKTEQGIQKKKRQLKLWDENEDAQLKILYEKYNGKWSEIIKHLPGRSVSQCRQRWRRTQPIVPKRKQWTAQEDQKILELVQIHGKNWKVIASHFNGIISKQVRQRYINKIDPLIDNSPFTEEEDKRILQLYNQYGCKWSQISLHIKGRPENMIKNRFYCYIRRVHLGIENPYQIRNQDGVDVLEGIDSYNSDEDDLYFYQQ